MREEDGTYKEWILIRCRSLLQRAEKELFGPWNFLEFCSDCLVLMSVEVRHQHSNIRRSLSKCRRRNARSTILLRTAA